MEYQYPSPFCAWCQWAPPHKSNFAVGRLTLISKEPYLDGASWLLCAICAKERQPISLYSTGTRLGIDYNLEPLPKECVSYWRARRAKQTVDKEGGQD